MKEKFRELRLNKTNQVRLGLVNSIIEEYAEDGYVMTLRQLYYQLVSRDVIPNKQAEYAKLSKLLKEGRMAGLVDWNAIEDRLRVPKLPYWVHGPQDAINDTISDYRLNRQRGQDHYIEVWVEKDALSGVLKRVTQKYHIRLLVNRGYGSVTAVHDAYNRLSPQIDEGKDCHILYLGDHDPSGMDMIRDIDTRVSEMLDSKHTLSCGQFNVNHIALTTDQVAYYKPPENPAKKSDPRAKWYVEKFGNSSWEVDALNPKTLNQLLTDEIESIIDIDKYNEMLAKEDSDKNQLIDLAESFNGE